MKTEFKKGDVVKLITLKKSGYEDINWIKNEKSSPKIGDTYTVINESEEDEGNWLILNELTYDHPSDKFKLA